MYLYICRYTHLCMHIWSIGQCQVSVSVALHLIFLNYLWNVFSVCVYTYGPDVQVEVRGQHARLFSILLPCASQELNSQFLLNSLATRSPGSSCFCFLLPSAELQMHASHHAGLYVGTGVLDSGPHDSAVSWARLRVSQSPWWWNIGTFPPSPRQVNAR